MTSSTLPVRVRRITLAVIALSGLVGSASAQHIGQVIELETFRTLKPPISAFWAENALAVDAAKAKHEAHVTGLESMRGSRMLILFALTIACSLTFVAALRMLRPGGSARESARKLLATTAIACAVLRTMDGAQMAANAGRAGAAWDRVMKTGDIVGGYPEGLEEWVMRSVTIAFTVLITGAFVGVATYFRSDAMRQAVEAADRSQKS